MKKLVYLCSILMFLVLASCIKEDVNEETGIQIRSVDKDIVETPGGQSGKQGVDKDKVESPGSQSGSGN